MQLRQPVDFDPLVKRPEVRAAGYEFRFFSFASAAAKPLASQLPQNNFSLLSILPVCDDYGMMNNPARKTVLPALTKRREP